MINTYNETHLHRSLKNLYSSKDAYQEVPLEGFICDIYDEGRITEIQTSKLSALKAKLEKLLPHYPVKIVYPIIENAYILTLNADGSKRSCRKSPKHGSFYQIFRELLGIVHYIDNQNFTLHILYVDCEIIKIDDKKGKSRYKRPRIIDKQLLKIHRDEEFYGTDSLIAPFIEKLPNLFISSDVKKLANGTYASYIISFLKKCKKIVFYKKAGRYSVYKKTGAMETPVLN